MKSRDRKELKEGDLVVAIEDVRRQIHCMGIIVECRSKDCRVIWGSQSNPIGWWRRDQLELV